MSKRKILGNIQAPDRKVKAGALAGGAVAFIMGLVQAIWPIVGQRLPGGFEAGTVVLVSFAISYWVRSNAGE